MYRNAIKVFWSSSFIWFDKRLEASFKKIDRVIETQQFNMELKVGLAFKKQDSNRFLGKIKVYHNEVKKCVVLASMENHVVCT